MFTTLFHNSIIDAIWLWREIYRLHLYSTARGGAKKLKETSHRWRVKVMNFMCGRSFSLYTVKIINMWLSKNDISVYGLIVLIMLDTSYLETNEPRHDKTNIMGLRPAWIQTSLRIRAIWSGSMLFAYKLYNKYRNW
jgi:hypothetical protein